MPSGQIRTVIEFSFLTHQIRTDDEQAPPTQRHTAMQVFRRLRDEHGYPGGYGQVQRYLRRHRARHQETFIPLGHLPGQRLEADFGHIHVDCPDGRRLVPFLVTTWAYSNAPFVLALPFERTEAILEGMVAAFEFYGAVAKQVWWDNPKAVATLILRGRERQLHPRYAALASHYTFDPLLCMPARGNEKPDAEGAVKAVQRRFATPVPRVADLAELNAGFRRRCEAERPRVVDAMTARVRAKQDGRIGPEERLVVIRPVGESRIDYALTNAGPGVPLAELVRVQRQRHRIEQVFEAGNGEAGLDHYEVRSWVGWHHHMTLSLVALWFLCLERRRLGGENPGGDGAADAADRHAAAPPSGPDPGGDRRGGHAGAASQRGVADLPLVRGHRDIPPTPVPIRYELSD